MQMFINYKLEDGSAMVEVTEEVAAYILDSDREIANAERRERYHVPYNLEALKYEDSSLAYHETPERIVIRKEESEHINDTLSYLTDAQLRRLIMKSDGMTLREIAAADGTTVNAVLECLEGARKKFRKNF